MENTKLPESAMEIIPIDDSRAALERLSEAQRGALLISNFCRYAVERALLPLGILMSGSLIHDGLNHNNVPLLAAGVLSTFAVRRLCKATIGEAQRARQRILEPPQKILGPSI